MNYFLEDQERELIKLCVLLLKGKFHGSAHAHLSTCCFSAWTCCIVYASEAKLYAYDYVSVIKEPIDTLPWQSLDQLMCK